MGRRRISQYRRTVTTLPKKNFRGGGVRRRYASGALAPAVAVFCVLLSGASLAAPAASPGVQPTDQAQPRLPSLAAGPATAFVRPSVRPVRINASEAPAIDADLNDA